MEIQNRIDTLDGKSEFHDVIYSLKSRFYTAEEFPFLDRSSLPRNVLTEALQYEGSKQIDYALGLTGKQLESILFDLKDATEPAEIQAAVQLLKARISSRLIKLLVILFQYYDSSKGLNEGLNEISEILISRSIRTPEEEFVRQFGGRDDKVEAVREVIDHMRWNITECMRSYGICEQSVFAEKCVLSYLNTANRAALLLNRVWIVKSLETQPEAELKKLIENYLSTFLLTEFNDGICLAILNKMGQPYISPEWDLYPLKLKKKFLQWLFLHQLKIHTLAVPKKYKILLKYIDQVRNSYVIEEENLLIIDFGDIVIADVKEKPYSFFYQKDMFETEMSAWQSDEQYIPAFIRMDRRNLTARDFIIEELEEACIKLSYEGIDILYIQEMLDIKIGLEPDMRRNHLAKIFRSESRNKRQGS